MSAQDIIMGSRVAHVRELKTEIERLRAEAAQLRAERDSLSAHFDLALLAAMDLKNGEPLEIWDGWNLVLGSQKTAHSREELIAQAHATGRRVWIVFDGPAESVATRDLVRVSYTGTRGQHRADKFIVDFVRMARYLGLAHLVTVRTHDKDFLAQVRRLAQPPSKSAII